MGVTTKVAAEYMTVAEVAALLRISARALSDACRASKVAHVHIARQRRFTPEQVDALIAKYTVMPEADRAMAAERARALRSIERRRR